MTGARHCGDPWKCLAACIVERAQKDCRGKIDGGNNTIKALIQYDAERWLRLDPWCQFLLDCVLPWEYDADQRDLAMKEHHRRNHGGKSYQKCLPKISPTEQLPIYALAKLVGISKSRLNSVAETGLLNANQQVYGTGPIWCTSLAEIAKLVTVNAYTKK